MLEAGWQREINQSLIVSKNSPAVGWWNGTKRQSKKCQIIEETHNFKTKRTAQIRHGEVDKVSLHEVIKP